MSVLLIQTAPPVGQTAVTSPNQLSQQTLPSLIYILTNDTFATVTATGYLTYLQAQGYTFSNEQMALVYTTDQGPLWLRVVITYSGSTVLNTVVSLTDVSNSGDVVLPTIANYLAHFTGTTGTISSAAASVINAGNIQAGLSGTAGYLASFPATASTGSLRLVAVSNSGDTLVTISNALHGQASVYSIPDAANAVGRFLVGATATPFTSGNFPVASGVAGLMVDSGVAASNLVSKIAANTFSGSGQIILAKANGVESSNAVTASGNAGVITTSALTTAAGSTYSITWTNTKITATSVIGLTIQGGTNTVQSVVFTCAPGAGTATLVINNIGPTNALNGTILIGYSVL